MIVNWMSEEILKEEVKKYRVWNYGCIVNCINVYSYFN